MLRDGGRELRIDVALTPWELAPERAALRGGVAIVVDVIRATTTLCVLFDRGCRRVLLAPSVEAALAAKVARPAALLAGEVGGAAPLGFDLGNSPSEVSSREVREREVIFATTNGTRALRASVGAGVTLAGSLRNANAVAHVALACIHNGSASAQPEPTSGAALQRAATSEARLDDGAPDLLVVCAGRGDRPAYDDTVCAGYLCRQVIELARAAGEAPRLGEGARVALATVRDAGVSDLRDALAHSDAARAIARIGLARDLDWCAALDASHTVPHVIGREDLDLLVMEPWLSEDT